MAGLETFIGARGDDFEASPSREQELIQESKEVKS